MEALPSNAFHFPDLTAADCANAIKELKTKTAVGPDGWRPTELKQLPPQFAQDMCQFFSWLEQREEHWPVALRTAWVTPIPKATRTAADNRSIAVFSAVYRAWAAARGKQLRAWLDTVMPKGQCGFRAGRGVESEAMKLCSKLEVQQAEKTLILSVDFSKAYDGVQHDRLLQIAGRLGLSAASQHLLRRATLSQFRQWRLCSQYLGEAYEVKQGLAQGCSLSVSSFNIYALPMIKALEEVDEEATVVAYADDLIVATSSEETLERMIAIIERFSKDLGLKLNAKKCEYAITSKKAEEAPAEITIGGATLQPVSSIDLLGVMVNTATTPFSNSSKRTEDRKKEARKRLNILATLDVSWEQKAKAAAASPMAKLAYGSWATNVKPAETKSMRHLMATAVHGQPARGPRAIEVLIAGFGAIHTQDYKWIPFWKALREWQRSISKDEEAWQALREKLEGRRPLQEGPIATLAAGLAKLDGYLEGDSFVTQGNRLALSEAWSQQQQHKWREAIRQCEWHIVKNRRGDLQGIHQLDRRALRRQQSQHTGLAGATLRTIQSGGVLTPDRLRRHSQIGDGKCSRCAQMATMKHILWECRFTEDLRSRQQMTIPETEAEQGNALPLLGRTTQQQDKLAAYAIAALQQRRTLHKQAEEAAEPPSEPENNTAAPEEQEQRNEEEEIADEWEELQSGIVINHILQRLRCLTCEATSSTRRQALFVQCHTSCRGRRRRFVFGPAPLALPTFVSFLPASASSGARIQCEICGASAHSCHRASFLSRHSTCAGPGGAAASISAAD